MVSLQFNLYKPGKCLLLINSSKPCPKVRPFAILCKRFAFVEVIGSVNLAPFFLVSVCYTFYIRMCGVLKETGMVKRTDGMFYVRNSLLVAKAKGEALNLCCVGKVDSPGTDNIKFIKQPKCYCTPTPRKLLLCL